MRPLISAYFMLGTILSLISLATSFSFARDGGYAFAKMGGRDGGGGDRYVQDFIAVAKNEILPWLKSHSKNSGHTINDQEFLAAIEEKSISSVERVFESCRFILENNGTPQEALVAVRENQNDPEREACYDGVGHIFISRRLYPLEVRNSPVKRRLVAHEIFRKMGIEKQYEPSIFLFGETFIFQDTDGQIVNQENYFPQKEGTNFAIREEFDSLPYHVPLSELEKFAGAVTCRSYDKNFKEEFAQDHSVLVFVDRDQNTLIVTHRKGVNSQSRSFLVSNEKVEHNSISPSFSPGSTFEIKGTLKLNATNRTFLIKYEVTEDFFDFGKSPKHLSGLIYRCSQF